MDVKQFNWHSKRARYARYGKALHSWIFFLQLSGFVLFGLGVACLVLGMVIGWALVGLVAVPIMIVQWYKRELAEVPVDKTQKSIDARVRHFFVTA